jgi:hypothetical protein
MRILADLLSHTSDPNAPEIIQVQRVPETGSEGAVAINGKFAIPVPLGMDFPVDAADYILDAAGNIDGGDVVSKGYAHLLAMYPQYGNIYFNPLLTSDHVAELVLDQSFWLVDRSYTPAANFYPRFQTGREEGVPDDGQMPTHTAMLGNNNSTDPERPGLIITEPIDIGPYTLDCNDEPVGTDQFMVYWKLYAFDVTDDVAADYGRLAGYNVPAYRMLEETDQEPAGFSVWLTTDDGANWCQVNLLEPVAFCDKTTSVRLAFRNDTSDKIFLASYALLF